MLLDSVAFVQAVRQYRLLDARQIEELARLTAGKPPDARALAKDLLGRGWLTPYQANQLLQGRGASLLLDSYVLLERLGEGGMGAVYKARNWKIGRVVALKLIRRDCLDNETIVRRFHREIEAAAQLSHPNIIHAFDAGEAGGTHFFVMEYTAGTDLSRLVKQVGPLPVRTAGDYVRQAALGLQHAHERGMVHRDIKPSNLLLTTDGIIKLLDMGLARLTGTTVEGETTTHLTQEGAVMGTPDYIAPEQTLDAHTADIRADLYSLGCTLYYLLAGRVPFPGGTLGQKIAQHLSRQPVPVRQLRPDVPERVAAIIARLMAKRPEDRFQTPGELAAELADFLTRRPEAELPTVAAAPPLSIADPLAFPHPSETRTEAHASTSVSPTGSRGGKRLAFWSVGAAVALGGCLLLAASLFRSRRAAPANTRPATLSQSASEDSRPSADSGILAEPDLSRSDSTLESAIQGEYAGNIGGKRYGAQVLAQGKEQYVVYLLAGGLPGDGWDQQTRIRGTAWKEGENLLFRSDDTAWRGQIVERRIEGRAPDGAFFRLQRMQRHSATLGARPPAGAVVLFDGSGVEEWIGGRVEDGLLQVGAVSKRAFGHCRLHLEFRLPLMPDSRGQGRGNSGVMLQNRYEVQILDSFGLPETNRDGGSIYGQTAPLLNTCLPPLTWQTYDIEFQAARYTPARLKAANAVVSVRHNGILIHDRTPLTGPNTGVAEGHTPGPLVLQAHDAAVVFRNIWIVPLE